MFQILQEALEANSLEHKLEMQIKASLDSTKESGAPEQTNNDTELLVQESI